MAVTRTISVECLHAHHLTLCPQLDCCCLCHKLDEETPPEETSHGRALSSRRAKTASSPPQTLIGRKQTQEDTPLSTGADSLAPNPAKLVRSPTADITLYSHS